MVCIRTRQPHIACIPLANPQPRLLTKSNEKAITTEFREITGAS